MKKTFSLIACLLLIAVVACGCGKSTTPSVSGQTQEETTKKNKDKDKGKKFVEPALCGTWSEDIFDSGFIFKEDGTGTDTFWDLTFTYYSTTEDNLFLDYDSDQWGISEYTYSISGNELSMTRQDEEETSTFVYTKK